MKHADVEVPQTQPAVLTNAAKTVVSVIAAPGVKSHRCDPGLVALATGDNGRVDEGPDGDEVVLAAGENILAVRRPAHGYEAAVVRVVEVKKPGPG
jgi:hypothetical protein